MGVALLSLLNVIIVLLCITLILIYTIYSNITFHYRDNNIISYHFSINRL